MIKKLFLILLISILILSINGCGVFSTASAVSLMQQKQDLRDMVEAISREQRMNKLEDFMSNVEYDTFKNSIIKAAGDAYTKQNK